MEHLQKKAVSVTQACRVLQVSQSGYYAARMRGRRVPRPCVDSVHLKAAFAASGRAYGSRRLCAALQKQGVTIGRNSNACQRATAGLEAQVCAYH